jgi:hypothetical protein
MVSSYRQLRAKVRIFFVLGKILSYSVDIAGMESVSNASWSSVGNIS